MMATRAPSPYDTQRDKLARYFDGTARKAWIDLTSEAPVSGIRATVRAGRESMRAALMGWLPDDMSGLRVLDAGCGTGALTIEAAGRGAQVTAIDIAAGLVEIGQKRAGALTTSGTIDWRTGDMLDPALDSFDHVVAMDSLIHYPLADIAATLVALGADCRRSMLFTFAPQTPLLSVMHKAGKLFPRSNRSPAIIPVREARLRDRLARMQGWRIGRDHRVSSGFYTSHAIELVRRG